MELAEPELRRWMREHTSRLLAVVRAYAADDVEVEDLLQETWLRAYRHALARPDEVPVAAWLTVIALNVGRDHRRRRARRERLRALWGRTTLKRVEPEPELRDIHPGTRLWRAVGDLPTLQRQVVVLRIVQELSIAETARALDRAEGTVKVSLSRALRTLRRGLLSATPITPLAEEIVR